MTRSAVGVDVGGLRLKAVHLTEPADAPRIVDKAVVALSDEDRTREGMVRRIARLLVDIGAPAGAALGLAVPGAVRRPQGVVARAANLPGWEDFDIAGALEPVVGRRPALDNDGNVFTLAETRAGAARGRRDVLGVVLGTGIGGGIIADGRVHRGAHGLGAEIGHVVLHPDGAPCGCGARGCVEQYASSRFLLREGRARCEDLVRDVDDVDVGKTLADAARDGHEAAAGLFVELGRSLGAAVAGMANVLDPETIVIGGGLARAFDLFFDSFRRELETRAFARVPDELEVVRATLGDEAGAIGAALLALEA